MQAQAAPKYTILMALVETLTWALILGVSPQWSKMQPLRRQAPSAKHKCESVPSISLVVVGLAVRAKLSTIKSTVVGAIHTSTRTTAASLRTTRVKTTEIGMFNRCVATLTLPRWPPLAHSTREVREGVRLLHGTTSLRGRWISTRRAPNSKCRSYAAFKRIKSKGLPSPSITGVTPWTIWPKRIFQPLPPNWPCLAWCAWPWPTSHLLLTKLLRQHQVDTNSMPPFLRPNQAARFLQTQLVRNNVTWIWVSRWSSKAKQKMDGIEERWRSWEGRSRVWWKQVI